MDAKQGSRDLKVVLEGQYKAAYELLEDAVAAGLTPIIIGPPGVGKSLLARKFATDTGRPFREVFFDELLRPAYLVGTFNPALVLQKGYCPETFEKGPLIATMEEGGVFLAQELNRASEFCQNSLLEPLEERSYYVPRVGRVFADERFVFVATANPAELAGTHQFSEALRDRLRVWIPLTYPDRETEMKIIRVNCEPFTLPDEVLEKVHHIVKVARAQKELEMAVSIRAGIAIARLAARHIEKKGKIGDAALRDYSRCVFLGAAKGRTWLELDKSLDDVIEDAIKAFR